MDILVKLATYVVFYGYVLFYGYIMLLVTLLRWAWKPRKMWTVKNRDTPPACLLDPDLGTHSFLQMKGIKLHYVEKGDKNKPLILFLHGFPEIWYSWRHQLREFSREYWVVAVDLRGYGDSEKPKGIKNYALSVLVDDIKQVIEALGRSRCILVGHDWGGVIGWTLSKKYPEMVEKYIAMNIPHPQAFRKHVRLSLKQFFMSWYIMLFQIPWLPEQILRAEDLNIFDNIYKDLRRQGKMAAEDVEGFKYAFREPDAFTGPLNYYRNSVSLFCSRQEPEGKVEVPSLLIFGDQDKALDWKMAHMSADYVENFTLKKLEGISHWVQQEAPEQVNKIMWEYLKA